MDVRVGDTLLMKKEHPCGSRRWRYRMRVGSQSGYPLCGRGMTYSGDGNGKSSAGVRIRFCYFSFQRIFLSLRQNLPYGNKDSPASEFYTNFNGKQGECDHGNRLQSVMYIH